MKLVLRVMLVCAAGAVGLSACSASLSQVQVQTAAKELKDFVPIDPLPADQVTFYDESGAKQTKAWNSIPMKDRSRLLPDESALTIIEQLTGSINASYLTASVTGEAGSYRVTMDFVKYVVDQITDPKDSKFLGYSRTGVGIRIKANVLTTKANVNLGSLMALGVAAQEGSAYGQLSVELIGIDSKDITNLFPMPSQIDQTSIQKVLEAVAAIKAKLGDDGTILTPQVVAVKLSENAANVHQLSSQAALKPRRSGD